MCTSIAYSDRGLYGRNLDLDTPFGEQVVITPRDFPFTFHHLPPMPHHPALTGMATVAHNTPLYAEAANEHGLYMAGLYFPGNAHYFDAPDPAACNVAPFELIPLVLGRCKTLAQARELLATVRLVAEPFAPGFPLAPLHWHIADATGALVAEPMADGLHLYEDPAGVLTNNPPFPWHQTNLHNYRGLSTAAPANSLAPSLELPLCGQGFGALGLPGDASPVSRYLRAMFTKAHAVFGPDRDCGIVQFFHVLDAVAMVRGTVTTDQGGCDETRYSSCIDAQTGTYYYKTYDSGSLHAVTMDEAARLGSDLRVYPLQARPLFHQDTPVA